MYDIMKGDCLDLMKQIPDNSADMILCDLPYGTTQNKWDEVIPFEALWAEYRRIRKPSAAIVLTAAQPFTSALIMSNPKEFKYQWVWDKVQPTGHLNAKKQPMRRHEDVIVFYAEQPIYNPQLTEGKVIKRTAGKAPQSTNYGHFESVGGDSGTTRQPTTILQVSSGRSPNARTVHPTQKPVALMEYLIRTYTNEGMTVLDNCFGSGTTGVACANTGRKFIGIEMDEKYFEIAKNRVESAYSKNELDELK